MRKDQQREIEAWKAAKRANTLRRSIDEAVQETARKSPRKLNPKEELERRNRLEKLEKWKREKEMKKREDQLRLGFSPSSIDRRLKWGASSRWPFRQNSAWGTIEATTIGKKHPTL